MNCSPPRRPKAHDQRRIIVGISGADACRANVRSLMGLLAR